MREKNDAAHDRIRARRKLIVLKLLSVLQCKATRTENNNCELASHTNYSVLVSSHHIRTILYSSLWTPCKIQTFKRKKQQSGRVGSGAERERRRSGKGGEWW